MVASVTSVLGSPLLPGRELLSYPGLGPGSPTPRWRQVISAPAPTPPLGLALSGAPGGAHAMAQVATAATEGSATASSAAYPFPVSSPPAVYRRISGPALLPMQLAVAVQASPLASPGTTHRAMVHAIGACVGTSVVNHYPNVLTTGASPAASSSVWAAPVGSANLVMDHLRTPRMVSTPMSPAPLTPRPSLATPTPRPSPATTVPGQSPSASAPQPVASAAAAAFDGAWAASVGDNTASVAATGAVAGVDAAVGAATAGRFPSSSGGGAATAAALAEAAPPPALPLPPPPPLLAPGSECDGDGVAALRERLDKAIGAARDAVAAGGTEAPASDAYLEGVALRWQLWNLQRPAVRTLVGRPGASSPQATPSFEPFVTLPRDVASFVASLLMELDQAEVQSEQGFAAMADLEGRLTSLLEEEAGGSGGRDWRAEAQGLQKLCERLAEDLSRMHKAYADNLADAMESCGNKDAAQEQLKQVEFNLEMLGGENLRLRRALDRQPISPVPSRPAAKALASRRRLASVSLPRAGALSVASGASAARRGGSLTLEPSRSAAARRAASASSSKPGSLQLPLGGPAVAGAEELRERRSSEPLQQAPGSEGGSPQRLANSAAPESAGSSPQRRAASDCGSTGSPRSPMSSRSFLGEVHPGMSLADAMGRWRRRENDRAAEARHVASRRRLPSPGSGGSVIWAPPSPKTVGGRPTL